MNYAEAVEHLYALGPELPPLAIAEEAKVGAATPPPPRRRFDLAHMRVLCTALGDPQAQVPAVLIAGTNGKGSTAATLASILTAAGYRTGLYTSPHLVHVNERIQLAHPVMPSEYGSASAHGTEGALELVPITDDDFARLYTRVDEVGRTLHAEGQLPLPPSFFERLTAVAFLFFAGSETTSRADMMVLEVGLGGRLDATNIVEPLLSILTDIALDHQEYLGSTISEITREKCGILREHGVLITLPQHEEANRAIGVAAEALKVRAINAAAYIPAPDRSPTRTRIDGAEGSLLPCNRYVVQTEEGPNATDLHIDSPLPGQHQQRNVALAIAAALELRNSNSYKPSLISNSHCYNITDAAIEAGIRATKWPGRLETIKPNLLLDVAHNPAGAWALRGALASLPESQPRTLIFSCLRDKDLVEMSRILFPLFDSSVDGDPMRRQDHLIFAPIANPRAAAVEDLLAASNNLGIPAHAAPHLAGALAQARQITPANGLIIATGSVYLVGEIRELASSAESLPA